MRLLQPRLRWVRQLSGEMPVQLPFPVWHALYRHPHHAGRSGYDRLSHYVGTPIEVGQLLYVAGETVLRPLALFDAKYGGQFEYSRYDWVLERAVMGTMRRTTNGLFHFLYGEKNFRHSGVLAGRRGNRLVATFHHPVEHHEWLFRSTRHLSDLSHVIVMSETLKGPMEALVGRGRVSVVPYGVDVDYFVQLPDTAERDVKQVVFAGFHERDYETLERVVEIVVSSHDAVRFLLISLDPRCVELGRRHSKHVRCVSRLSDDDYLRALQTSDLMVLPLKRSVAVTAVLEAMACGVPVLTTEGGIRDYVVPDGGLLFQRGDVEAMAGEALRILGDDARLSEMKVAARRRAQQCAWPVVAQRTAEVYRIVMGQ